MNTVQSWKSFGKKLKKTKNSKYKEGVNTLQEVKYGSSGYNRNMYGSFINNRARML